MSNVNVIIRTADKARKAEITVLRSNTGGDVIQSAVDNWALPVDTDYALVNASTGKTLLPGSMLTEEWVNSGDILEVQPVLVAGACVQ